MSSVITQSSKNKYLLEEDEFQISYLHPFPVTPGVVVVETKQSISSVFHLSLEVYKELFIQAKKIALLCCNKFNIGRCAMITSPSGNSYAQIKIIPLHGIPSSGEWKSIVYEELEYNERYPGYSHSKSAPLVSDEFLNQIQSKILEFSKLQNNDFSFYGDAKDQNLFARLVRGELKQWRIWEDSRHVAFLTPYPNTAGFTVVVPRTHLSSNIFSIEIGEYEKLVEAGYKVSMLLRESFQVENTCMIFEGYEIDYAHIKIIPIGKNEFERKNLPVIFHPKYLGYVTSLDGPELAEFEMKKIHKLLINE